MRDLFAIEQAAAAAAHRRRLNLCPHCYVRFANVLETPANGRVCPVCLVPVAIAPKAKPRPVTQNVSPLKRRGGLRRKVLRLLERDGELCWLCNTPMGDDVTMDHVVPVAKGGTDGLANLRLAHSRCNSDRGHEDAPAQRQDSLTDQMRDVLTAATQMGCYDAADWIKARWPAVGEPSPQEVADEKLRSREAARAAVQKGPR